MPVLTTPSTASSSCVSRESQHGGTMMSTSMSRYNTASPGASRNLMDDFLDCSQSMSPVEHDHQGDQFFSFVCNEGQPTTRASFSRSSPSAPAPSCRVVNLDALAQHLIRYGIRHIKNPHEKFSNLSNEELSQLFEKLEKRNALLDNILQCSLGPNVETLCLQSCYAIRKATLYSIAQKCPNLHFIDLSGCAQVENRVIEQLLLHCTKLRTLILDDVRRVTDGAFCRVEPRSRNVVERERRRREVLETANQELRGRRRLQEAAAAAAAIGPSTSLGASSSNSTTEQHLGVDGSMEMASQHSDIAAPQSTLHGSSDGTEAARSHATSARGPTDQEADATSKRSGETKRLRDFLVSTKNLVPITKAKVQIESRSLVKSKPRCKSTLTLKSSSGKQAGVGEDSGKQSISSSCGSSKAVRHGHVVLGNSTSSSSHGTAHSTASGRTRHLSLPISASHHPSSSSFFCGEHEKANTSTNRNVNAGAGGARTHRQGFSTCRQKLSPSRKPLNKTSPTLSPATETTLLSPIPVLGGSASVSEVLIAGRSTPSPVVFGPSSSERNKSSASSPGTCSTISCTPNHRPSSPRVRVCAPSSKSTVRFVEDGDSNKMSAEQLLGPRSSSEAAPAPPVKKLSSHFKSSSSSSTTGLANLRELSLCRNSQISAQGVQHILRRAKQLRSIKLSGCNLQLTENILCLIFGKKKKDFLQIVDLSFLTGPVESLEYLLPENTLRELNLGHTNLTDSGVQRIRKFCKGSLEKLLLPWCGQITDQAFVHELEDGENYDMDSLRVLDVCGTAISDETLRRFVLPHLPKLEELDISWCQSVRLQKVNFAEARFSQETEERGSETLQLKKSPSLCQLSRAPASLTGEAATSSAGCVGLLPDNTNQNVLTADNRRGSIDLVPAEFDFPRTQSLRNGTSTSGVASGSRGGPSSTATTTSRSSSAERRLNGSFLHIASAASRNSTPSCSGAASRSPARSHGLSGSTRHREHPENVSPTGPTTCGDREQQLDKAHGPATEIKSKKSLRPGGLTALTFTGLWNLDERAIIQAPQRVLGLSASLQTLRLDSIELLGTDSVLRSIAAHCPNLQSLGLQIKSSLAVATTIPEGRKIEDTTSDCSLANRNNPFVVISNHCPHIHSLSIDCAQPSLLVPALAARETFPQLKILRTRCPFFDNDLEDILRTKTNLEQLTLDDVNLADETLARWYNDESRTGASLQLESLLTFHIRAHQLTDLGASYLAKLLPSVLAVELDSPFLTKDALQFFLAADASQYLRQVQITSGRDGRKYNWSGDKKRDTEWKMQQSMRLAALKEASASEREQSD
ncbi:unnamed protein product [Amoebophrya sp. A120]|nr:unnamed protein product [Amoebophrya sp. A120]|eukprot:GSA120T00004324001.1